MKRQLKVSTEQKHLNEKEIQSCFSFMNSFWGFDRMVFNLSENLIVDIEKLIEFRKTNPREVKKFNYNSNQIEDLIIQSREFGRLEIGKIYKKENGDTVNYCLLQLNHGDLNFETLSISAIQKKLINVPYREDRPTGHAAGWLAVPADGLHPDVHRRLGPTHRSGHGQADALQRERLPAGAAHADPAAHAAVCPGAVLRRAALGHPVHGQRHAAGAYRRHHRERHPAAVGPQAVRPQDAGAAAPHPDRLHLLRDTVRLAK